MYTYRLDRVVYPPLWMLYITYKGIPWPGSTGKRKKIEEDDPVCAHSILPCCSSVIPMAPRHSKRQTTTFVCLRRVRVVVVVGGKRRAIVKCGWWNGSGIGKRRRRKRRNLFFSYLRPESARGRTINSSTLTVRREMPSIYTANITDDDILYNIWRYRRPSQSLGHEAERRDSASSPPAGKI